MNQKSTDSETFDAEAAAREGILEVVRHPVEGNADRLAVLLLRAHTAGRREGIEAGLFLVRGEAVRAAEAFPPSIEEHWTEPSQRLYDALRALLTHPESEESGNG